LLSDAGVAITPVVEAHNVSAWAQYTIQVHDRAKVQERLEAVGVPTAVHYPTPLNQQPAVADETARLPIGDALAEKVLSLPMHPYLDQAIQSTIVRALLC